MKYLLPILICVFSASCSNNYEEDYITVDDNDTIVNVSYIEDVTPILNANCVNCHNPDNSRGDVVLSSYSSTINTVVPGSGDISELYRVIAHISNPMPPSYKLSNNEIETIKVWIDEGASNN